MEKEESNPIFYNDCAVDSDFSDDQTHLESSSGEVFVAQKSGR